MHAVYVFVGVLLLSDGALRWIAGSLVAAIGVGYGTCFPECGVCV